MPAMELGVLSDMPNIRKKACMKLFKQQVLLDHGLASVYMILNFLAYVLCPLPFPFLRRLYTNDNQAFFRFILNYCLVLLAVFGF